MRTHLRESMLALLLIGILATGCDTGTKKASENSITFDSISVEKTYHLLDNPDNPNCNLEIKFVYPRKYSDKEVLRIYRDSSSPLIPRGGGTEIYRRLSGRL